MKLKKMTPSYVTYAHNNEPINLPRYKYRENDVRGIWISTVANIDTPLLTSVDAYKEHLVGILDQMKEYNMNTAIFQIRPMNDAFYPSKINPWSRFITGTEDLDPGFDIFGFFIEEAKKRNIKVHAWMNPYRVGNVDIVKEGYASKEEYLQTLSEKNWARRNPEHTVLDGKNQVILAPSHKEVIQFIIDTVSEVAENYDIEAFHIDDYFYPYAKIPEELEMEDYLKYRESVDQSMDDFRRMNVDKMIYAIHDTLKNSLSKFGKKIQFGISPFAIYRIHSSIVNNGWDKGIYTSRGALQCYSELYSDVYKWMKEGWIDYVVPQNYFSFERNDAAYHNIAWWWANICKETNTTLYMGQGLYLVGSKTGWGHDTWQNPKEIANQLKFNCNFDNIQGTIFFTYHDIVPGKNKIKDKALLDLKKMWNK